MATMCFDIAEISAICQFRSGADGLCLCNEGAFDMIYKTIAVLLGLSCALTPIKSYADSFFFDDSTVSASGQQMSVTRLPVRRSDGTVVYRDVIVKFVVNSAGQIIVKSAKTTTSPPQIVNQGKFVAGKYYLTSEPNFVFELVGPQSALNGHNLWTIRRNGSTIVRIYTGPVKGHPYEAAIRNSRAKGDFAFGITDEPFGGSAASHVVNQSHLVGAQVTQGEISFNDFGNIESPQSVPSRILVLTKCKAADNC